MDRYTRIVLTVIAACLVWICVRDVPILSQAEAQDRREQRLRQQREQLARAEQADDDEELDEAMPVKIVAVDESLFKEWPRNRNSRIPTPLPVLVNGGQLRIENVAELGPWGSGPPPGGR